jgi:hypothetical protein
LKYFYYVKVKVFQTNKTKQNKATSNITRMAFYNTLFGDYDNTTNGGKEDKPLLTLKIPPLIQAKPKCKPNTHSTY